VDASRAPAGEPSTDRWRSSPVDASPVVTGNPSTARLGTAYGASVGLPLIWVDAFTDTPFAGNPAAICLLDEPADEAWMQHLAGELGVAETAYLVPRGDHAYGLRWFTPTVEIPLCGHATLASAHALYEAGLATGPLTFHTRSGALVCTRRDDGFVEMDFQAVPPTPVAPAPGLLEALRVTDPLAVLDNEQWFIVVCRSAAEVERLAPDMRALERVVEGASVTARSDRPGVDIVSRVFGPGVGVDEDYVTGSVHCALTPYWAAELGTDALVAYQASSRGGTLHCRLAGERVLLAGPAVTVLRGEIEPP
jgi:PhzF family phenazine biosynthesis protein